MARELAAAADARAASAERATEGGGGGRGGGGGGIGGDGHERDAVALDFIDQDGSWGAAESPEVGGWLR
eukprot:350137-Chlamydomonas_euryale.AAC.6